jgi:hypothetical protein
MKKLLASLLIVSVTFPAFAGPHGHGHGYWHRGGGGNNWHWVAPALIGGVIGYEISRNQQPVIVQQPVVVQNPPVLVQQQQSCSPWTETQNPDGTITRTRICSQ